MSKPDKTTFYVCIILILIPSVLFFVFVCPFLIVNLSPLVLVCGVLGIIYVLVVLCLTSYTDPGIIPQQPPDPEMQETISSYNKVRKSTPYGVSMPQMLKREILLERGYVKVSYCTTCNIWRPPRCSHCSDCGHCIENFDHHCPWVGNCVGKRNYRFFLHFVFSTAIVCLYIFSMCVTEIVMLLKDSASFLDASLKSPFSPIIALYTFFIFLSVAGLACYHQYLICNGVTTNEELKGVYKGDNPWSKGCVRNCLATACFPPAWPQYPRKDPLLLQAAPEDAGYTYRYTYGSGSSYDEQDERRPLAHPSEEV